MSVNKIFLNYKQFVDDLISDFQIEIDNYSKIGDDYFIKRENELSDIEITMMRIQMRKQVGFYLKEAFDKRKKHLEWLKLFLTENLIVPSRTSLSR